MNATSLLSRSLALFFCVLAGQSAARTEIVYDNTATPTGNGFHPSNLEYGDEIQLQPGLARLVTDFYLEYFGEFIAQGDERVRIRFYANNGPDVEPGPKTILAPKDLLYESAEIKITPGFHQIPLTGLAVEEVPDTLTWTVKFSGLSGAVGDRAGLLLYNPPTVGKSFNDFWQLADSTWTTHQIDGGAVIANFGARVVAIVPEPGVVALSAVGGLLWLGIARLRRSLAS